MEPEMFERIWMIKENLPGIIVDVYFRENGELGYIIEGDDEDHTIYMCPKSEVRKL